MSLTDIPILAQAISIVIAWALFALFCSYLHEAIAQIKAERGRFFKKYLLQQLQDLPNGVNWALLLYQHGSIDLLSRDPEKPTNDISPDLFSKTLIEVVGSAHLVQMRLSQLQNQSPYANDLIRNFAGAVMVLQPSDVVSMLKQSLADAELKALNGGIVDEGRLYEELQSNVKHWYIQLLQRVSLWYKKKTRQRLFLMGICLGALLNVDSIQLFLLFSQNKAARDTMISYYAKNKADLEAQAAYFRDSIPVNTDSTAAQTAPKDLKTLTRDITVVNDSLNSLSKAADLPVGISHNIVNVVKDDAARKSWKDIVLKITGILISGFAASFGAPFWFDLLKKVYTSSKK